MQRRDFLRATALSAGALAAPGLLRAAPCALAYPPQKRRFVDLLAPEALASKSMGERFARWFEERALCRDPGAVELVWNFVNPSTGRGNWLYPMLSAKAALWHLERGQLPLARRLIEALLPWQQISSSGALARSFGAFPSRLEATAQGFVQGDYYYSGDNLVILEALVALYGRTKEPRYLNSAVGVGTWLTSVMCQGHRYGVWLQDHAAPMAFVTKHGDFNNHIPLNVEMLWIGALTRLGGITGESAYCAQAARAQEFYRQGQLATGPFYDHYDPGYPPRSYSRERWQAVQSGQVISDNQLRSALGACRLGDLVGARRFFRWLKTQAGGIPAYLSLATGQSGFPDGQPTYFDVSSTGLYRSLAQWLGEDGAVKTAVAFLQKVQSPDGGWHWGLLAKDLAPVTAEQAPVAGFWATADLSTLIA